MCMLQWTSNATQWPVKTKFVLNIFGKRRLSINVERTRHQSRYTERTEYTNGTKSFANSDAAQYTR